MFALGLPEGSEWLWIILAVVILFGPRKIPELARSLGRSIGEFKRAKEEFRREMQTAIEEKPTIDSKS
jgi:sec-independent protein translocase protein TatA